MSLWGQRFKASVIHKRAGAVLLIALALAFPALSEGSVKIEGVPRWLKAPMERSAESVWSEIKNSGAPGPENLRLLALVAGRVFSGYSVAGVFQRNDGAVLSLEPGPVPRWRAEIDPPRLSPPADLWFRENASGLAEGIEKIIRDLPLDALSWADVSLKKEVEVLCSPRLPGWSPSILVRLQGEETVLRISFAPRPPLVLAVVPKVSSGTLPVMLQSDLNENILRALAPVAGLPIEWAEFNKKRVEDLASDSLRQTRIVDNTRSAVRVIFNPGQLAAAEASVESPRYSLRAWVAAYAGSDTRYPEIGLHMGRKFLPFSGWDMELYGEWILAVNDLSLESRWGVRWSPWKGIMAGAEQAFPGNQTWYRLWYEGGERAPYLWWRVSERGLHNAGVGYRINRRVSLEVHYDGRDEDKLSLKAISDL